MFDFHIHSAVSYDSKTPAADYVRAAEKAGFREICFTDHMDYIWAPTQEKLTFTDREYREAYEGLSSTKVKIRKGFEFGLLPDNRAQLAIDLARYDYDFVLGSVHMVDGIDRYFDESYWQGCTQEDGERRYFETVLSCVENHRDFDVLGHLTYVSKMPSNPQKRIISYGWYRELFDEILTLLADRGQGIEVNTSGLSRCGAYLPHKEFLQRFKELGGQIVTVGSDAHSVDRLGENCEDACRMVCDVFGYVATYEKRRPVFHKL